MSKSFLERLRASSLSQRLRALFGARPETTRPRLNLALQGGGAHGAFTWGVLDALLESDRFDIATVSGASAGAMNAVVLAHGLTQGAERAREQGARAGSDEARRIANDTARMALSEFWLGVGKDMPFDWITLGSGQDLKLSPWGRWAMQWTQWLAPAQLNPLDVNPLRDAVEAQINFDALRTRSTVRLLIATTHANTGRLHLFKERQITADVLMASACLPTLFRPVMIDGEPHWDGGYSANPPLLPLVFDQDSAADTLLVTLAPMARTDTPTTAEAIRQRLTEFAFQGRFVADLGLLAQWQKDVRRPVQGEHERMVSRARWHWVDGAGSLADLRGETRLLAHAPFLQHLHGLGREHTLRWLAQHGSRVGQASSVDLDDLLSAQP